MIEKVKEIQQKLQWFSTSFEDEQLLKKWAESIIDECVKICSNTDESAEMEQLKDNL